MTAAGRPFSNLGPWLEGQPLLQQFIDGVTVDPKLELGGFVATEFYRPLHEAVLIPGQTLQSAWDACRDYVEAAWGVLGETGLGDLDREEAALVRETLGEPPPAACPLYFLTARVGTKDEVLYVGRTRSSRGRFISGHRAIVQMHHPAFSGVEKRVYMASVMLLAAEDYLPLEWVQPLTEAEALLDEVEWQLIHHFQPRFNSQKRRPPRRREIVLQFEDFTDTLFLADELVFPLR